ncbi:dihydrofolate reductase family protein [Micromonospora sp. U56]|nr:dihydrofolate reductase family protein [Micromonospora sp. U56]
MEAVPSGTPASQLVDADPVEFVRELKRRDGGDIWLAGGGQLAGQLLPEVDELVVKLNPFLVGRGVPIVDREFDPRRFRLVETRPFDSGVVVLRYLAA